MWRPPEEIQTDLESGDRQRISAGLRDLAEAMEEMDEFVLAPLDPDLLAPFGHDVPTDVQKNLADILAGYRSFEPALDTVDRLYYLAVLAVAYADHRIALEAAMACKLSEESTASVTAVLDRLAQRGLDSDREVTGAGRYLSYLIAGSPALRAATIQALTRWNQGRLRQAVGFVRPELDDDEARVLGI